MPINLSVAMSANLSATAGNIAQFDVLVEDSAGAYVKATTANLTGGRLPRCIAITAGNAGASISVQEFGPVPGVLAAISGSTGEAYATVNASGNIQRTAVPAASDVVVGWVSQDGTLWANFAGRTTSNGASTGGTLLLVADSDQAGAGTNNTPALQAAIDALTSAGGGTINVGTGFYRLSASSALPGVAITMNKRVKIVGTGSGQYGQGTTFVCDAGVTGFYFEYTAGQDAALEDLSIIAASKLATTTAVSWNGATYTATLASASAWTNGQIVRMKGAGGKIPLYVAAIAGQSTAGSPTLTLSGVTAVGNKGFRVGDYVSMGTAWPTRTRITAINGTPATTLTLATNAATTQAAGQIISLYADVIARVKSGGGAAATALVLDNIGASADGATVPTYPFTGSPATTDLVLEHHDCGVYAACIGSVRNCTVGIQGRGFAGSGIHLRGATSDQGGSQNSDFFHIENVWAFQNYNAVSCADGDGSNGGVCLNVLSVQSTHYAFQDYSALGMRFVNCHADGNYAWITGPSTVNATVLLGCYVEGGSISYLGPGTNVVGGNLSSYVGGYSMLGSVINRAVFGDCTSASAFTNYEFRVSDPLTYCFSFKGPNGTAEYQFLKTSVASEGVVGWWGLRHQSGTAPFGFLLPDTNSAQWATTTARIWLPDGYHWGGHVGSLSDTNLPVHDIGTDPSALAGVVGSHRQNRTPAIGQPKGWYCTVTGGAGAATWVSEGNLV